MNKYNKPIFYIGTQIASNLMTIRTYVEEYNPDHHDYKGSVYSFNLQEIVNTFNHMRDEFIQIRNSVPIANQSLTDYQKTLEKLKNFNPNIPVEK